MKVRRVNLGGKLRSGIREGFIITRIDQERVRDQEGHRTAAARKSGGVLVERHLPERRQKAYYGLGM
ncbi:MAG: hypothetical protein R2810_04085 [Flavobacteriales bacterium]